MAIAVRGTRTYSSASAATSISVSVPTGTDVGDLLLLVLACDGASSSHSTPFGWTALPVSGLNNLDAGNGKIYSAWYKQATDYDVHAPNFTLSWTGSNTYSAVIIGYSGVDRTTPLDGVNDVLSSQGSFSASPDTLAFTGVTTATNNAMVVVLGTSAAGTGTTNPTLSTSSGMTIEGEAHLASSFVSAWIADVAQAAAGASGTKSFTLTAASDTFLINGWTLCLREADLNANATSTSSVTGPDSLGLILRNPNPRGPYINAYAVNSTAVNATDANFDGWIAAATVCARVTASLGDPQLGPYVNDFAVNALPVNQEWANLRTTASASGTATADLTTGAGGAAALAATPSASSICTGALTTAIQCVAAPSASATCTGALTTAIQCAATPSASATCAAALTTAIQCAAAPSASATCTGGSHHCDPVCGDAERREHCQRCSLDEHRPRSCTERRLDMHGCADDGDPVRGDAFCVEHRYRDTMERLHLRTERLEHRHRNAVV